MFAFVTNRVKCGVSLAVTIRKARVYSINKTHSEVVDSLQYRRHSENSHLLIR